MSSSHPTEDADGHGTGPELGDLWSWGLETSRAISDRLLDMYRDLGSSAIRIATGDLDSELRRVRVDAERLADLSVDVFDRMVSVARQLASQNGSRPDVQDALAMRVSPGRSVSAQVWVHNVSSDDHAVPRIFSTPLVAADGSRIAETDVEVELAAEPIAPRNSRSAVLTVRAPATACGIYRGWLLSDADPESAIAVRIEVLEPVFDGNRSAPG
jgi:hypothetical protein